MVAAEVMNGRQVDSGFLQTACWAWRREWLLAVKRPQDTMMVLVFHWMVVSLFPFGIGADSAILYRVAPGVFWVCALLATVLWLPRVFADDAADGTLEQIIATGVSPAATVFGKMLSAWILSGGALALLSGVLGLQFGLKGAELATLVLSLLLGTLTMAYLGSILAAMALLARQNPVLVPVLALPLFVPVLIFGAASLEAVQTGMSATPTLTILSALALLAVTFAPPVAGFLLKMSVE